MQGANCCARHYLTASDMEFLFAALTSDAANREGLMRLLVDPEALDQILDSDGLCEALARAEGALSISARLFFYLHIRRAFLAAGLDDRDLADYIAGVCAEHSQSGNLHFPFRERKSAILLSVDYVKQLNAATGSRRFFLLSSAGNHYLFMTGFFAPYLERRSRRKGAPDVGYYEQMGRQSFAAARDHRLAREYALEDIFDQLAQVFPEARRQLGGIAEQLKPHAA